MAIKGFKQVVEKKGYRLDDKDRKIFEKEIKRGYFGFDVGDIIEFVIYDSSDNQLPQESVNGHKVRYINYTDENIKEYFDKVPENKFNKKSNNAKEYYIDTEKLIKEGGYSNGVFKTQITLLNRRLGSEPRLFDKAWIHEISPSRTEVRVLPVVEDGTNIPNSDLQARYDTFVNCGTFTADVLIFIDEFINQFDVAEVIKNMLMKKGTISEGQNYIKLIEKEFKLVNFEVYLTQAKKLFQEIVDNYRMNRYYNPFESNFGQPTGESFGVEFDIASVFGEICEMASNAAEYTLPKQDIRLNTAKNLSQSKTLDELKDILLTVRSNDEYSSDRPTAKSAQIRGCTDPAAKNYNPAATISSQCVYDIQVAKYRSIKVCNDSRAINYGNDGNCIYPPPPPPPPPPTPVVVRNPPPSPPPPSGGSSGGSSGLCKYGRRYSFSAVKNRTCPAAGQTFTQPIYVLLDGERPMAACRTRVGFKITGFPSWITPNLTSNNGSSASNFRYTVAKNMGAYRSATITITHTSASVGGSHSVFTVKQAAATIKKETGGGTPSAPVVQFSTSPANLEFNSSGRPVSGIAKIHVNAPAGVSWNTSPNGAAIEGIIYNPTSGVGSGTIAITSVNPSYSTLDKSAYIDIILTSGAKGMSRRTYVKQYKAPRNSGFGPQGDTVYTGGAGGNFLA